MAASASTVPHDTTTQAHLVAAASIHLKDEADAELLSTIAKYDHQIAS